MPELMIKAAGPFKATVVGARSFDGGIFFTIEDKRLVGWSILDAQGVAICAAAEAAGKPVYMTYQNHDPNWGNVGYFHGVRVALRGDVF